MFFIVSIHLGSCNFTSINCFPSDPEPCETGDPVLDDNEEMNEVWNESFGTTIDGLNHSQRNEAMFMVNATQSGYEIIQIPPGPETSPCFFDVDNFRMTSNIVVFIHTHPYSDGDIVNDPRCGSGNSTYDGDDVSNADAAIVQATINSTKIPPTPIYVIDQDKIRVIDPSNPSVYAKTINRCGY